MHEPDIEVRLSQIGDTLDWCALYGNRNPVEVELGCGKGRFIIRQAQEHPRTNYFGIEKSGKYFRMLKQRAARCGTANIRLLRTEAGYFAKKFIPAGSVQAFHIYFPDPWPKKRHHKRRLVNPAFMQCLYTALTAAGSVYLATDFEDYFVHMIASARACPGFEEVSCRAEKPAGADPEDASTHYERKYLMQGRNIYKAVFVKAAAGPAGL